MSLGNECVRQRAGIGTGNGDRDSFWAERDAHVGRAGL